MTTLTLRKVGGSTMLALSPALLQILGRRAGEQVVIKVESGTASNRGEGNRDIR